MMYTILKRLLYIHDSNSFINDNDNDHDEAVS